MIPQVESLHLIKLPAGIVYSRTIFYYGACCWDDDVYEFSLQHIAAVVDTEEEKNFRN